MAATLIRIQGLFFFIYMHNAQSFLHPSRWDTVDLDYGFGLHVGH